MASYNVDLFSVIKNLNELENQKDMYIHAFYVFYLAQMECVDFWDKAWDFGGIYLNIVKCDTNKSL